MVAGPCRIDLHDLDYYAQRNGPRMIEFHELIESFDRSLQVRSFTHVPSRDFNADKVVDLQDFALLAWRWRSAPDPDNPGATPDLDADALIDADDLTLFTDFRLERTDAADDPNDGSPRILPSI